VRGRISTAFSLWLVILVMLAAVRTAHSQRQQTADGALADESVLQQIVALMEEAQLRNRENHRPYIMTRDYRLFGSKNDEVNSEVIADVTFVPPDRKSFTINSVQGSERGEKIVRKVLQGESELSSKDAPGALSRANYKFKLLGEDNLNGQSCFVLQLIPKREEKTLLKGKAWVDRNTYLIHRVEGEMAKTPSWWIKKVTMTMYYSAAAGMWLATGSDAVAEVRIFGRHTLTSRALKVRAGGVVAQAFSSVPPPALRPASTSNSVPSQQSMHSSGANRHRRPSSAALLGTGTVLQR